uniref:Uncharacterized protein n=1 Tax=Kalanchoe fedtschenkoi TaxID=63787 RepID=A0A7N0TJW9_KALFE
MTKYSSFAVDLATSGCFLLFQETKLSSTNIQYPDRDLL